MEIIQFTDAELREAIHSMSSPAYLNLSKTHNQYAADIDHEARRRSLKL